MLGPSGGLSATPIERDITTLGSGSDAHVRIPDPELASLHASIQRDGATYLLVRHAHPVSINGLRPKTHLLRNGDLVVLGRTALSFRRGLPAEGGSRALTSAIDICRRLNDFTARVEQGCSREELAERLLVDALALTGATDGTLVQFGATETVGLATISKGRLDEDEASFSSTILRKLRDGGEPLYVADTRLDASLADAPSLLGGEGRTVIAAPVRVDQRLEGALYLSGPCRGGIDERLLDVVVLYAALAASAICAERTKSELGTRLEDLGEPAVADPLDGFGRSPEMQRVASQMRKVAASSLPVLLLGESGTGKEVIARAIHRYGPRAAKPMIAVHCGAIPEALLASELFGHVRGAFTQAVRDRPGFFRAAEGGTLFLDEIGEMPLGQQVALLRVLQESRVTPVGSDESIPVDVRVICATNQPLRQAVTDGKFRQDLYFRIAGITLELPPLRERGAAVLELANRFLAQARVETGRSDLSFSDAALAAIRHAPWEGNVRELEAAVRRAALLAERALVAPADLGLAASEGDPSFVRPLALARDEFLKRYVRDVVASFDGNRTAAAEALLVTPRTVFRYMEEI